MREFVTRHGLEGMTQAVDRDLEIWAKFDVPAQPAWVFINQDGETSRVLGPLAGDGLNAEIDALLAR